MRPCFVESMIRCSVYIKAGEPVYWTLVLWGWPFGHTQTLLSRGGRYRGRPGSVEIRLFDEARVWRVINRRMPWTGRVGGDGEYAIGRQLRVARLGEGMRPVESMPEGR
jgi:hypothetical protein